MLVSGMQPRNGIDASVPAAAAAAAIPPSSPRAVVAIHSKFPLFSNRYDITI